MSTGAMHEARRALGFRTGSSAARERFAEILARSFSGTSASRDQRLLLLADEELLLVEQDGAIAGGVIVRKRRLALGGRFTNAIELAALAIESRQRANGLGRELFAESLRRGRAAGAGLAVLRGSRTRLYERSGCARVGSTWLATLSPQAVALSSTASADAARVRRATRADRADLRELERRVLRSRDGARLSQASEREAWVTSGVEAYVVLGGSGLEGFVAWTQRLDAELVLRVHTYMARTARAHRRLLELVLKSAPLVREVRWRLSPHDEAVLAFAESPAHFERRATVLARVLDVERAFGQRGYRQGITARHEFALTDELLPENRGAWVLTIANGRGCLERGGRGVVELDANGAAAFVAGAAEAHGLTGAGGSERREAGRRLREDCSLSPWNTTFSS